MRRTRNASIGQFNQDDDDVDDDDVDGDSSSSSHCLGRSVRAAVVVVVVAAVEKPQKVAAFNHIFRRLPIGQTKHIM